MRAVNEHPWAGRRLHFVGIGGAGMSGLALIARKLGASVTGSDKSTSTYLLPLQTLGIESAQFPHATFVLSSPVTLPATATSGAEISVSLHGSLTIHGTTKTVSIPVQARLTGSQIEVVGSITFPWGEFNMQAPNVDGFVTVDSTDTMEFDLFLKHG